VRSYAPPSAVAAAVSDPLTA